MAPALRICRFRVPDLPGIPKEGEMKQILAIRVYVARCGVCHRARARVRIAVIVAS